MSEWSRSDYLEVIGIIASVFIAIAVYLLQKKLSDKQKVDHRLEVEAKAGLKIQNITQNNESSKTQIYNSKLLNKKYFAQNKRDIVWGYPYHAAELYRANFDGLEFTVGIEKWKKKKLRKVGVLPFERILGIKAEGDGSFNGMIFYVKPKLLQRDKYAIAYGSYRYYDLGEHTGGQEIKSVKFRISGVFKKLLLNIRYVFYTYWKLKYSGIKNKAKK
jgi:hypothetical protein